ncbi:MAG: hypothetical protein H6Q52_1760 [Deltaproteobacteria bacterium]|nr:hypothetical protein [Deltaproteobacteria bacterium]
MIESGEDVRLEMGPAAVITGKESLQGIIKAMLLYAGNRAEASRPEELFYSIAPYYRACPSGRKYPSQEPFFPVLAPVMARTRAMMITMPGFIMALGWGRR